MEYSKWPVSRSGDGADNSQQSKWAYFKPLLFLKDLVTPRASHGSIKSSGMLTAPQTGIQITSQYSQDLFHAESSATRESEQFQVIEDGVIEESEGRQADCTGGTSPEIPLTSPIPTTPLVSRVVKRKRKEDDFNKKMCDIEERKLQYLCDKEARKRNAEDADTDLMFLKSLLPHIRKIPPSKKLRFQSRVQMVVEEFAYNHNNFDDDLSERAYQSYTTSSYSHSPSPSPSPSNSFNSVQNQSYW